MAMILFVGPNCLGTGQALTVGRNEMHGPVCKPANMFQLKKIKERENSLLDLIKMKIIKTFQHSFFHLLECLCAASNMKSKLCHSPVLLDEIQLTVVFGIVITQITT